MSGFMIVTLLDSVHFRRALPPSATERAGSGVAYDTRTQSILDEMLAMNYKYIDLPTVTIGTPVTIIAYPADPSPLPVPIRHCPSKQG